MKRIFLIGYMGSGKTTIGKVLSRRLGLSFIDLDTHIEERFHKTVRQIFDERGEERFRSIEKNMLHEVADFEDVVISCGGGTPCFFDNMDFINTMGTTIFLEVQPSELTRRLDGFSHTRPILKGLHGASLQAFIQESLEQRRSVYDKAQKKVDASALDSKEDIDAVVEHIAQITA